MLPGREIARQALPRRHVAGAGPLSGLPGPVRSQGRSHALSVPRRVWNLHRNNAQRRTNSRPRPGQPVVSCAGCSLNEPRGGPRSLPGWTPTRPTTSPGPPTAMNAHIADSADGRPHRSRPHAASAATAGAVCRRRCCRRSGSSKSRRSPGRCRQVRFSRSADRTSAGRHR